MQHRFSLHYADRPHDVGPPYPCVLCSDGEAWRDGVMVVTEFLDGYSSPVCDNCLERENPDLLEATQLLRGILWAIAKGKVTPEAIEQRKRAWIAEIKGEEAATAMPVAELPTFSDWHPDELFLTLDFAFERLEWQQHHADVVRALTGHIGLIEAGPTSLKIQVYEEAPTDEKPIIAAAARERLARRRAAEQALSDFVDLVPEPMRHRYLASQLRAIRANAPDLAGADLVTALVECCDHALSRDSAAHFINQAGTDGTIVLKNEDSSAIEELVRR